MIEPALRDDAFLADVAGAAREAEGTDRFHLWWLGQSGFLVQWRGYHLLLDPYLSDSLTRKYAGTDKPHVRMTARVVDPERLAFAPDCGLSQTARWAARRKLENMVAGVREVRAELGLEAI